MSNYKISRRVNIHDLTSYSGSSFQPAIHLMRNHFHLYKTNFPIPRHHKIPFATHKRKSRFSLHFSFLASPSRMELSSSGLNLSRKGRLFWVRVEIESPLPQFSAGTVEQNRFIVPRASICGLGTSNPLSLHPLAAPMNY